jgi:hypothetical protein
MKIEKIISQFREEVINNYKALDVGDSKKANDHMKKIMKLHHDLVAIGDEGKKAIIGLMNDNNLFVQCYAAFYSLPYEPQKAEKLLKKISSEYGEFLGLEAGKALENWENGVFKNIEEL